MVLICRSASNPVSHGRSRLPFALNVRMRWRSAADGSVPLEISNSKLVLAFPRTSLIFRGPAFVRWVLLPPHGFSFHQIGLRWIEALAPYGEADTLRAKRPPPSSRERSNRLRGP